MRALLDVNVLVALLDGLHLHHKTAITWLEDHLDQGWASCPLTQNGCLRIMSQSSYANAQPTAAIAARLKNAVDDGTHAFWPDSLSLVQEGRLDWSRVLTSRQITDAYLLALATANGGRLVTFDRGISVSAVPGAKAKNLLTLGTSA